MFRLTRTRFLALTPAACNASGALVLMLVLLFSSVASAQGEIDKDLLDTWVGTSRANKGDKATVGKDYIILDGKRTPLRFVAPGVLVIGSTEEDRVRYRLKGNVLTTTDDDGSLTWRRVGSKPKATKGDKPTPKSKRTDKPLEKKPADTLGHEDTPSPSEDLGTIVLRKHSFNDAGFGGIESHTLLLPADWKGEAGVVWTDTPSNFVHFVGSFEGPDGSSIAFDYNREFAQSTDPDQHATFQAQAKADRSGAYQVAWPPKGKGQIAANYILPKLRPGAMKVTIIETKNFPEAERRLRKLYAPVMSAAGPGIDMTFRVERTILTYEQDGRPWEEAVQCVAAIVNSRLRTQYINWDSSAWQVAGIVSLRAPRGKLESRLKRLTMIASTLKETPRWSMSRTALQNEIARIKHEGTMFMIAQYAKRARIISDSNSQISDMQMASWKERQSSLDGVQKATVNSILEVHDYELPDGGSIALDNSYDRVFRDGLGNIILTNDPSYDPGADSSLGTSDWNPLRRVKQLGN